MPNPDWTKSYWPA